MEARVGGTLVMYRSVSKSLVIVHIRTRGEGMKKTILLMVMVLCGSLLNAKEPRPNQSGTLLQMDSVD